MSHLWRKALSSDDGMLYIVRMGDHFWIITQVEPLTVIIVLLLSLMSEEELWKAQTMIVCTSNKAGFKKKLHKTNNLFCHTDFARQGGGRWAKCWVTLSNNMHKITSLVLQGLVWGFISFK